MKDELEALIDQHTLSEVLEAITDVCYEKGEHIATNWQDAELAKDWDKAGSIINDATADLPDTPGIVPDK